MRVPALCIASLSSEIGDVSSMSKPSKRTFHRYVVEVEVLSESEQDLSAMGLSGIAYAIIEGDCSGVYNITKHEVVDGKRMAELLLMQGSDSGFFQLDENGNDIEDEE